ncbi:MAG TPA: 23S rRNA (adenine(2503)-C(2))-methyltransferase RlmN [Victivallales bacterium]|nr:23S rRNA (adenine(2503)-C(2))-methyltransferase RlmN [Victivallales bacterium]
MKINHMTRSIFAAKDDELEDLIKEAEFEDYRLNQISKWLYSGGVTSFDDMKNIPGELRRKLSENYHICSSKVVEEKRDESDETVKLLLEFPDGESVENAIIKAPGRTTFCLSSQCGCAVGCVFCASGANGLTRNLLPEEIVEEFVICKSRCDTNPDNIVFMGVGDPLMNYDSLVASLGIICSPAKFGISPRRITVSTSGYVPGILKFAAEGRPWNLALSLHSTDDLIRRKIVPNIKYTISEMLSACSEYRNSTGRIVTIEYVMLDGINSSESDAAKLARLCGKNGMKINLIPFNQHPLSDLKRPSDGDIAKFENVLRRYKVPFTRRFEKGSGVRAACGQLMARHKSLKKEGYQNEG